MSEEKTRNENVGTETGASGVKQQSSECCDAAIKSSCAPMMEMMIKKFSGGAKDAGQDSSGSPAFEIPNCCGPMVERMFRVNGPSASNDGKSPHQEDDTP